MPKWLSAGSETANISLTVGQLDEELVRRPQRVPSDFGSK